MWHPPTDDDTAFSFCPLLTLQAPKMIAQDSRVRRMTSSTTRHEGGQLGSWWRGLHSSGSCATSSPGKWETLRCTLKGHQLFVLWREIWSITCDLLNLSLTKSGDRWPGWRCKSMAHPLVRQLLLRWCQPPLVPCCLHSTPRGSFPLLFGMSFVSFLVMQLCYIYIYIKCQCTDRMDSEM